MARAAAAALVVTTGCIAPAQTIGAVDQIGTSVSAGETTEVGTSTGEVTTTAGPSESSSGDLDCNAPCPTFFDCQEGLCVDGQCVVSFRDELCEPGEVCTPTGCVAEPIDCSDPSVLVCEGFETETFAAEWSGGSIDRTSMDANRGAFAGQVSVGPNERMNLSLDIDPPLADGTLAIRSYVKIPSVDFIDEWVIIYEIFGRMNAGSERYSLDLRDNAGLQFVALPGNNSGFPNGNALVPGMWACVELRMELSETQGAVEVRVNDQPIDSNLSLDTIPVDGIANINVGGTGSPDHDEVDTFLIDDIVIARGPIGCGVVAVP